MATASRPPDRRPEDELEQNIERVLGALATGVGKGIAIAAEAIEEHQAERKKTKERRDYERDLTKAEKRRAKVDAQMAGTSRIEGAFIAACATAAFVFVGFNPDLWLVGIPAFFTMLHGVRILGWHSERDRLDVELRKEKGLPEAVQKTAVDPREQAANERCDRLLAALKEAPEGVRSFLPKPEETVAGLRRASLDVLRRERTLRELASADEGRRLDAEREGLLARIGKELDAETRDRLESALIALDQRREQQVALLRNANRMEAEALRLSYVIDGLYAQVQRVKAVGGHASPALEGLRTQVETLRSEMSALADAVEQANAETTVTLDRADTVSPGDAIGEASSEPVRRKTR